MTPASMHVDPGQHFDSKSDSRLFYAVQDARVFIARLGRPVHHDPILHDEDWERDTGVSTIALEHLRKLALWKNSITWWHILWIGCSAFRLSNVSVVDVWYTEETALDGTVGTI